ncbi:hypothetical protein ACWEGE_16465 [Amycolatopsis sp. NPDC004747]
MTFTRSSRSAIEFTGSLRRRSTTSGSASARIPDRSSRAISMSSGESPMSAANRPTATPFASTKCTCDSGDLRRDLVDFLMLLSEIVAVVLAGIHAVTP